MRSRIAWKLTSYFTVVLLVFAFGIGVAFSHFFKQHLVEIKKQEMQERAVKIAEVISENMEQLQRRYGDSISNSHFIKYLDNVTQEIVWVVDKDKNLNMDVESVYRIHQKNKGMDGHSRVHHRVLQSPNEAYKRLPRKIKIKVEQVFAGEKFLIEDYNAYLDDVMLTVGVPVYNKKGEVQAVVMLHSPVAGLREAAWGATKILFFSCASALVLLLLLSMLISWRFTKSLNIMKLIAERLADRHYEARCSIKQDDEIGDLANTLDILAERLQLADAESQKLERLRREFIANISHELRTPVTVIRGSLEALRDGVVTEQEEIAQFHEQMLKESVFLQRLINDLLDLSRLQNMDFPIEKEPVNVCDVIQDAVRSSRRLGMTKNLHVTAQLDTDVYVINGDYGRLRQMLLVFLHNSIKFSKEFGSIEVQLKGNCLTITDHGSGICLEDVEHVFDRFYKARNEANKEGSGLGLAIAKQIGLRHDISLSMSSEPDNFTRVSIILPAKEKVEEA